MAAALLALQGEAPAPAISSDPIATTRAFLEAFADDPPAAARFVTADAVVVAGDIGGPLLELVGEWRPSPLASCRVAAVRLSGILPERSFDDAEPFLRGGPIMVAGGSYACVRPDGSSVELPVSVFLKHGRVAMFVLETRR